MNKDNGVRISALRTFVIFLLSCVTFPISALLSTTISHPRQASRSRLTLKVLLEPSPTSQNHDSETHHCQFQYKPLTNGGLMIAASDRDFQATSSYSFNVLPVPPCCSPYSYSFWTCHRSSDRELRSRISFIRQCGQLQGRDLETVAGHVD